MPILSGTIRNAAGELLTGLIEVKALAPRQSADAAATIGPAYHEIEVENGVIDPTEIDPGPIKVTPQFEGWRQDFHTNMPDGDIDFWDLISTVVAYDPPVVSQVHEDRLATEQAKADAQAIVDDFEVDVIPDAGVAARVAESGSSTRSAVDARVLAVGNATYAPASGIAKAALAGAVQTSLGKADTAAQPGDVTPKLDKTEAAATYVPVDRSAKTNIRRISDQDSVYDATFPYEAIWTNSADGHITWSDLTIDAGFGGQVGQGGAISYFKVVGGTVKHRGPGNFDGYWMSVKHEGTREAGLFIGDIWGDQGGNVYGGHVYVKSTQTAPAFLTGMSFEIVPQVARASVVANTAGAALSAGVEYTSVTLGTAVQLTKGTNVSFTDVNSAKVTAYVSSNMGSSSTTVPVKAFTSAAAINSGSAVQVGVASAYFATVMRNSGNQTAGAAVHIEAPEYTGDKPTVPPFLYGVNLDISAASPLSTGIKFGGSWGTGVDMNGNTITSVGSIAGVGSSPNRDVRLVDNLLLDNTRHIKFRNAAATAVKTMSVTSSDNFRFIAPGASKQWEFYDSTETTLLGRLTGSGRADFAAGGVTTKYTSSGTAPTFLTNGHVEVWHDPTNNLDYLCVHSNGALKKVAVA